MVQLFFRKWLPQSVPCCSASSYATASASAFETSPDAGNSNYQYDSDIDHETAYMMWVSAENGREEYLDFIDRCDNDP